MNIRLLYLVFIFFFWSPSLKADDITVGVAAWEPFISISNGQPSGVILPANGRHPVKRINYATEVNHDKTIRKEKDIPEAAFTGI